MAKKRTVSRGARQFGKLTRLYESRSDQMKYCDWRRGRPLPRWKEKTTTSKTEEEVLRKTTNRRQTTLCP